MVHYDEDLDINIVVKWICCSTYFPIPILAKRDSVINEEEVLP